MTPLSLYALTAEAAYADWQNADVQAQVVLANAMLPGATATLLSRFECPVVSNQRVHQPDTYSGFSGTVFRSLDEPSFVFAARGTMGPADIATDAILATTGYAVGQLIDGYIFLKQCSTALGASVTFSTDERLALGAIVGAATPSIIQEVVIQQLNERLSSLTQVGNGVFVTTAGPAQVDFTGHSLGGHLTAVLANLAAQFLTETVEVRGVVVFNGAGFGGLAADVAGWTGSTSIAKVPTLIVDKLTHVISADGLSATADLGQTPGTKALVNVQGSWNPLTNHSITNLAQGCAIRDFLCAHGLTEQSASALLDVASRSESSAYSSVLEFVTGAIVDAGLPCPVVDLADPFAAISTLTRVLGSNQIRDLSSLSASELTALVAADSGIRSALLALRPVAVSSTLPTDAQDFSVEFWRERAEMFVWLSAARRADVASVITGQPVSANHEFLDSSTGERVLIGATENPRPLTFFGGQTSDVRAGSGFRDYLHGGAGADTLQGLGGVDLLEGGLGDDVLDGGYGSDTLVGGPGNDWLGFTAAGLDNVSIDERDSDGNVYDGGTGNDRISGSLNKDVYRFRRGDGFDYVLTHGGADDLQLIANVDLGNGLLSEITQDQVSFKREGLDLLVCINRDDGTVSDHVRIAAWFDSGVSANALGSVTLRSAVEGTVFRTWTKEEIESIALNAIGSEQGDTLTGLNHYRNVLQGRGGDDTLIGANSAVASTALGDTFVGGTGDDDMTGTGSGDTYVYFRGDGHDIIREQNDSMAFRDEVVFKDISLDEVGFTRVGNDLKVVLPANGSVTVKDWFLTGENRQVEFMSFTDQRLSADDITARAGIVVLTEGNDVYTGTAGADIIYGMGGNDTINGDPASGGGTGDRIYGGDGDDTLYGLAGNDALYGQRGNDKLYGGDGNDLLDGGDGDDLLDGGRGADTLIGGAGNDTLGGAPGSADAGSRSAGWPYYYNDPGAGNTYIGGPGNDTLNGTSRADLYVFNRGDGHDIIKEVEVELQPAGQVDVLQFGPGIAPQDVSVTRIGTDLVLKLFNGTDSITIKSWYSTQGATTNQVEEVRFADGTVLLASELTERGLTLEGTTQGETLNGLSGYSNVLHGLEGNDTLVGGTRADQLYGGPGNDSLDGGAGDDLLEGGTGNDTLKGGSGNDVLDGGEGNDTLDGGPGADVLIGGAGDDVLGGDQHDLGYFSYEYYTYGFKSPGAGNTYIGGTGNDTLNGTCLADRYIFNLGDGRDTLTEREVPGQPADQVDVLRFGPGIAPEDITVTRSGTDLMLAHANGTDSVTVKNWYTSPGSTANQVERVEFSNGVVWSNIDLTTWGLTVTGTAGNDVLNGVGSFNDVLIGGAGNDTLNGLAGDDTLLGGQGNDLLYGGSGNDHLDGGDGNDLLDGGPGADVLRGGAGDDVLGGDQHDLGYFSFEYYSYGYQSPGAGNTYQGGTGNDTLKGTCLSDLYLFNLGDGLDTLIEREVQGQPAGQVDVLKFGPGISAADVLVRRNGADLVLAHVNGSDSVTIKNWYTSQGSTANQVEEVQFADGTVWFASELTERGLTVVGTAAGETLTGLASYSNILFGSGGNDTLTGGSLADMLYGGTGTDTLSGGAGNDTYHYFPGDGYDTLTDSSGTADTLVFPDLDISAATFYKVGNDLEVFLGTGQGMLVKNQFATGGAVEFMLFGGQSYSASQIGALAGPKP